MSLKSLYISPAVSNLHETEIEIWAGFGLVGITEKRVWANYEQLLRAVFYALIAKKEKKKYCSIRCIKWSWKDVKKILKRLTMNFKLAKKHFNCVLVYTRAIDLCIMTLVVSRLNKRHHNTYHIGLMLKIKLH